MVVRAAPASAAPVSVAFVRVYSYRFHLSPNPVLGFLSRFSFGFVDPSDSLSLSRRGEVVHERDSDEGGGGTGKDYRDIVRCLLCLSGRRGPCQATGDGAIGAPTYVDIDFR